MDFIFLILYTLMLLIRPQEWVGGMENVPIVDIIAAITIFVVGLGVLSERLKISRVPENFLMIGFFCFAIMSHAAHFYLGGVLFAFQEISKLLIIYFLIIISVNSNKRLRAMIWFIILSSVTMVINGILQYKRGYGFGGSLPIFTEGELRIQGFGLFEDPNDIALLFVVAYVFSLAFLIEKKNLFLRVSGAVCAGLNTFGILLTHSRGGMIAFVVANIMLFRKRLGKIAWAFWSGVILFIALSIFPSRLGGVLDQSSHDRVIFWGAGNQIFKENPVFGVGYKMFMEYSGERSAHNTFVNCYAELGIFGYLFWVGVILSVIMGLSRVHELAKERNENSKQGMFLLCDAFYVAIIAYLTGCFFVTRTYIVFLYILIALGVKARCLTSNETIMCTDLLSKKDMKRVGLWGVGSILGIYVLVRLLLKLF